jgi:hypothetical protein
MTSLCILAKQALRIPFPSPISVLVVRDLSHDVPVWAEQALRMPFPSPIPDLARRNLSRDVPVWAKQAISILFPDPIVFCWNGAMGRSRIKTMIASCTPRVFNSRGTSIHLSPGTQSQDTVFRKILTIDKHS